MHNCYLPLFPSLLTCPSFTRGRLPPFPLPKFFFLFFTFWLTNLLSKICPRFIPSCLFLLYDIPSISLLLLPFLARSPRLSWTNRAARLCQNFFITISNSLLSAACSPLSDFSSYVLLLAFHCFRPPPARLLSAGGQGSCIPAPALSCLLSPPTCRAFWPIQNISVHMVE